MNRFDSRMLKKPASGVLSSSKSSTGTRPPHHSAARTDVMLIIRRTVRPEGTLQAFTRCGLVRDKARLGALGLERSLFEHPAPYTPVIFPYAHRVFPQPDR